MFSLDPPFKLIHYEPTFFAFGGVECQETTYNINGLTKDIREIVESIGSSLKRAYTVKTSIEQPNKNIFITKVMPITAQMETGDIDLDLRYCGKLESLNFLRKTCRRMLLEKKDNAIITRDNDVGLYFFHLLKERFDPISTGELLKATESILLGIAGQKLESSGYELKPNHLRVDVRIKPINKSYVV